MAKCPFCEITVRFPEALAHHVLTNHLDRTKAGFESLFGDYRCWCGDFFLSHESSNFADHIERLGGYEHHAVEATLAGKE